MRTVENSELEIYSKFSDSIRLHLWRWFIFVRDWLKNSKCNASSARSVENRLEQLGFEFREAMEQIRFEIFSFIRDARFGWQVIKLSSPNFEKRLEYKTVGLHTWYLEEEKHVEPYMPFEAVPDLRSWKLIDPFPNSRREEWFGMWEAPGIYHTVGLRTWYTFEEDDNPILNVSLVNLYTRNLKHQFYVNGSLWMRWSMICVGIATNRTCIFDWRHYQKDGFEKTDGSEAFRGLTRLRVHMLCNRGEIICFDCADNLLPVSPVELCR